MVQCSDARLVVTDGTVTIDLLDAGFVIEDPGWQPNVTTLKGGGTFVDPALAGGRTLVHGEYGNVVESIPLSVRGGSQARAVRALRDLLRLLRQASDYWRFPHTRAPVWLEARPAGVGCRTGYSLLHAGQVPSHSDPFRQPFYTANDWAQLDDVTLALEREPFWRLLPPGQTLGPLLNLLKNPDFELWTQRPGAVTDVEPDSWINMATPGAQGTNNRHSTLPHSGRHCLLVDVDQMYGAGRKGVYQVVDGVEDETTYTVVAWTRNEGVQYGAGRLLVTYGTGQLEVYRRADRHGWKLYTGKITTGIDQTVVVYCEIAGTGGAGVLYAGAEGKVYFDSLMFLEGDWEDEAIDGLLPYLTSSHVTNHWDQPRQGVVEAGDVNFVDCWDVPGDVEALVRLEFRNDTTPSNWTSPAEVAAQARIGLRRAGDVFDFDNCLDPPAQADADSASDDRQVSSVGIEWVKVASQVISGGSLTPSNAGRFRVYARVKDMRPSGPPTAELRLSYWTGASKINYVTLRKVELPTARDWCVVDLTRYGAVNWDTKFLPDESASFGYEVEARRSSGTADLELDYVLRLPTDGGVLDAEIDPPLTPENSLVCDRASAPAATVQASAKRAGSVKLLWEDAAGGSASEVRALQTFQGRLFVAGQITSGGAWHSRAWDGRDWTTLTHAYWLAAFEEYSNRLYAGANTGGVYRWTGSAWSLFYTLPSGQRVVAMRAYAGKLHVLDLIGNVYAYDGGSWTQPFDLPLTTCLYGTCEYARMVVYNNRLFLSQGHCGPNVYAWNGSAISLVGAVAGMTVSTALESQGGYLWIGGDGPCVGYYDGDAVHADVFATDLSDLETVYALKDYDGKVYAVTSWTAGRSGRLYYRTGGAWMGVPKSRLSGAYSGRALEVYDGVLYVGSAGYVANVEYAGVFAHATVDSWYKVADYRGSPFWAPNRERYDVKRHRYVFSWDRRSFQNVVGDRALVGVAVAPRYFTLLGEG